jgi:hypothetical protein
MIKIIIKYYPVFIKNEFISQLISQIYFSIIFLFFKIKIKYDRP